MPCDHTVKWLIPKPISGAPKNPQTLGEHIKKKRLEDKQLQKDIIKALKIDIATLSHWENNKTKIPVIKYPLIISYLNYCPIERFTTDGEKLTLYRKYQGMTQKKLAKIIGSDESYVCRWETMEYKIPYDKAQFLYELLNVKLENVAPNYHQRMPEKLEAIGDHLRKRRLELGLSARQATKHFSLKSSSSYRAWETKKDTKISVQFYPEIADFLGYCPVETFTTQGQQLLLYRKYAGLTQRQLADKLDVNYTTLMRWETDKVKIQITYQKTLKNVLGINYSYNPCSPKTYI